MKGDADGLTHTIHLDCGCRIRLDFSDSSCSIERGDMLFCTKGHSERSYDQEAGVLDYEYDREVVGVVKELFDGVTNA